MLVVPQRRPPLDKELETALFHRQDGKRCVILRDAVPFRIQPDENTIRIAPDESAATGKPRGNGNDM